MMEEQEVGQRKWLYIGVAIVSLALIIIFGNQARARTQRQTVEGGLAASGIIQAKQVSVASEFTGQIASIPLTEADSVSKGDVVVRLDTEMLDAEIEVALAMVEMAEAGLAQVRAGARPGQIAVAEAQLAQAAVAYAAAQQAVSDTLQLIENPQDIDLQIAVTRAQLESVKHQEAQAIALKDAVEVVKNQVDDAYAATGGGFSERILISSGPLEELGDDLPVDPGDITLEDGEYTYGDMDLYVEDGFYELYGDVNVSFSLDAVLLPNTWWQSWVGVNAAIAKTEGTQAKLAHLYDLRENPLALKAKVDEAKSVQAQLAAQVAMAEVQVRAMRSGATEEEVAALEARVTQARAGLEALQQQREMLTLLAPMDGVIVDVLAHPGEVIAAGAPLLSIADLEGLFLNVYVPQNRLGQVQVGQAVQIKVNSFPARVFLGEVSRIADRAEFTPRNVATKEERVNLVFAVEVNIENVEGMLKPGMPADVVFVSDTPGP